jgi:predicted permease
MSLMSSVRHIIDVSLRDFSHTLRGIVRAPGVCIAVIVTFGLGVGANAAVFTALDRVFFRPPSGVMEPGQLRRLYAHNYLTASATRPRGQRVLPFISARDLRELGAAAKQVADIEADYLFRRGRMVASNEHVVISFVSPGYFDLLGVRAGRGRLFTRDENRFGEPVRVLVVSDSYWRTHLAADPGVIGKTMRIADDSDESIYTVVGIGSPSFEGLELQVPDMWVPLANIEGGIDGPPVLRAIARLRPGVSDDALASMLTAQYRHTHANDPLVADSSAILVASIVSARGPELTGTSIPLIPGMTTRSRALLLRLGILGFVVFVIAVANVASLLLMRSMRRRREIAVRLALGVSRRRLIGQILLESVLLAGLASVVALVIARFTGGALRAQLSSFRWGESVVDGRVVAFALLGGALGGIIAGCVPALFVVGTDIARVLRIGGGGSVRSKSRLRMSLLVVQAALCTALLACGGAFLQSFRNAANYDHGFDANRLIQVSVPANRATSEAQTEDIQRRLRSVPSVVGVGRSSSPLDAITYQTKVGLNYRDTVGVGARGPSAEFVDADFMPTAGFHAIAGRLLERSDDRIPVTVLNESLARVLFPTGEALGACVRIREPDSPCRTVVGIVRDVMWDAAEPATYRLYIPLLQMFASPNRSLIPNTLHVRMARTATVADIRQLREAIDPLAPGGQVNLRLLSDALAPVTRPFQLAATLFLILGVLGLVAAATGIYGIVSFDVAERTREFGVRLALGATPASIVVLVVRSGMRLVLAGIAAGIVAAALLGIAIASLLFDASPFEPTVVAVTVATLMLAAFVATVGPAWRAVRVDPVVALAAD